MIRSDLAFYLVTSVWLVLLVFLTRLCWRRCQIGPATPKPTRCKREPKPFAGYTRKPECDLCEQGSHSSALMPGAPPPQMTFTRGRPRQVETIGHFCPHTTCAYHG